MIGQPQNAGQSPETPIPLFYTGKNIATTSGGRTANTVPLREGDVLVLDPFGFDSGRGTDVAVATTGYLAQKPFVVTNVPKDSRFGGWIEGVPSAHNVRAYVAAGSNVTAGTTFLGVANGSKSLTPLTSVASAADIFRISAIAHETNANVGGGTADALINVGFGYGRSGL
jgi:hypothetical protein